MGYRAPAEPERACCWHRCSKFNSAKLELNEFLRQAEAKRRAVSAALLRAERISRPYVPISQLAKYFFCSPVNVSMETPMPANLSRAISLSIAAGTGYTFFSRCL